MHYRHSMMMMMIMIRSYFLSALLMTTLFAKHAQHTIEQRFFVVAALLLCQRRAARLAWRRVANVRGRTFGATDLAHQLVKTLVDVHACARTRLDVGGANRQRKLARLHRRHGALRLEIALVAHNHQRHASVEVRVFHAADLLGKRSQIVERGARRDVVDEHEALAGAHVLVAHRRVLVLSSSIQDIQQSQFFINMSLFAIRILVKK